MWPHMQYTPVVYVPSLNCCLSTLLTHSLNLFLARLPTVCHRWPAHNALPPHAQLALITCTSVRFLCGKKKNQQKNQQRKTEGTPERFVLLFRNTLTLKTNLKLFSMFLFQWVKSSNFASNMQKWKKNINIAQWRWTALYPSGNKQFD